ncbi:MAG: hypothetical protein HC806_08620 [Anaerolineae bacterium]|nr:hypothetical protein [Anaerolineae bacterium]
MVKKFNKHWKLWLAVIMPILIALGSGWAITNIQNSSGSWILMIAILLLTLLFPLLFIIYREVVLSEKSKAFKNLKQEKLVDLFNLTADHYAIPISMLMSLILLMGGGLVIWDFSYGRDLELPG